MKLAHKIFAAVFLTSMSVVMVSAASFKVIFEREQTKFFTNRYKAITESLVHTLVQVEKNSDIFLKNAALFVQAKDAQNRELSTNELKSLAIKDSVWTASN